jgi:hypothetical protein
MSTIVLDAESAAALRQCGQSAVLKDADGNIVGYFEPPMRIYEEGEIPKFDEEELQGRIERHDVLSSEEVRRRLGIPPRK